MTRLADLPVVDAMTLPEQHRELLRPGELIATRTGQVHRLPRFFYAIASADVAVNTMLTPHFALWEFVEVDLHEPALLRAYPRYVPCAVAVLAAALEILRTAVGNPVRIAANGGYRSPSHRASSSGSPHAWATAANIYQIGNEYLDTEERITRYAAIASQCVAGCWTRPYGSSVGCADDHLHLDLGYGALAPRHVSETAVSE